MIIKETLEGLIKLDDTKYKVINHNAIDCFGYMTICRKYGFYFTVYYGLDDRGFWFWEGNKYDEDEDQSSTEGRGTNAKNQNYRFELYADIKGLDMDYQYKEGFFNFSEISASISNYEKYTKKGRQILISINPVKIYDLDEKMYMNSEGGHSMYVTGVKDGKWFYVSTWGMKKLVKLSDCSTYNYKIRVIY